MPINPMQFEIQESPFGKGLTQAIANRLAQAQAQTAENEAPYAGLAKQAQAASQFAYSHFMQPQYAAKLAGNQQFFDKLTEPQKQAYLASINQQTPGAGVGGTGGDQWTNPALNFQPQQNRGILGNLGELGSKIYHSVLGGGAVPQTQAQQPSQLQTNLQNMLSPPSQAPVSNSVREEAGMPGSSVTRDINIAPSTEPQSINQRQAANEAERKRTVEKAGTQGAAEGKQQSEYGEQEAAVSAKGSALNNISELYQAPALQKIVNTPFVNQKAISWYKNTGTPEEKEALGKVEAAQNSLIASSLKDFGSRGASNKDLGFLQSL